jgi:hypothetical protein
MDRSGFVQVSPDGRYVYALAPASNAIQILGRHAAVPNVLLRSTRLRLHHHRGRLSLSCPSNAALGCFGSVALKVLDRNGRLVTAGPRVGYDVHGGRRPGVAVRLGTRARKALHKTRHHLVLVVVTSREPSGDAEVESWFLPVRGH